MSSEVIKVLEDLSSRFGVVIDWTENNILSYSTELYNRIVKYNIFENIISIIISILILVSSIVVIKVICKNYKKAMEEEKSNSFARYYSFGTELNCSSTFLLGVAIFLGLICLFLLLSMITELTCWFFAPELEIIKYIKELM